MSGVVKIQMGETDQNCQVFSLRVKDAHGQEQQQSLYLPKTQTVQTVSSSSVRVGKHRT